MKKIFQMSGETKNMKKKKEIFTFIHHKKVFRNRLAKQKLAIKVWEFEKLVK